MPPRAQEGPGAVAADLADARLRANEKNWRIADVELSRKYIRVVLSAAVAGIVAVVILLYSFRVIHNSPLHLPFWALGVIDLGAALSAGAVLVAGFRSLAKKREEISRLRLDVTQLREAELSARSRMPAGGTIHLLWTYHSDVLLTIEEYRNSARGYRRIHNRFQTVIIIGSLVTTAISTAAVRYNVLEWVAVAVSFSVGVSAGMTGYFKFRERSMNLQQAADDLEQEYKAVELRIRNYRKIADTEERLVEFAERAESIKSEQRKREQQLEQPPEGGPGVAATGPSQGSTEP